MTSRPFIFLLVAGAIALACGPHARHGESSSANAATTDDHPARHTERPPADPKQPPIAASANVAVHDGITVALHVTNIADHAVELRFPSGQTHDFVVLDSIGREIWRWSSGRMFTQAIQNKLLDANETLSFEEHWDGPQKPGRYTAVAILRSDNHPVEQRIGFTLP